MIQESKVLGIIPARGGSKGVPRKNLREVAGKPLLVWTIEQAKRSRLLDRVVLSSEDEEIISVARHYGCEVPFIRPAELARDETPGIEPVLHAIKQLPGYDYVVLLQPTSPLRQSEDIDGCVRKCLESGAPACVSVTPGAENPYLMFAMGQQGRLQRLVEPKDSGARRQDYPEFFLLNGAVYVARTEWLLRTRTFVTAETLGFVMPRERSLDVDTEDDLRALADGGRLAPTS